MAALIYEKGSLVSITNYGPYFGCTGIIRSVEVIDAEGDEPLPFYLIVLHEGQIRGPVWFEHDAIDEVVGDSAPVSLARGGSLLP